MTDAEKHALQTAAINGFVCGHRSVAPIPPKVRGGHGPALRLAWHLSALHRFNGGTEPEGYSWAEHSIRLSWRFATDPSFARQALLLNGPKAYMGDPPADLMARDAFLRAIEGGLWQAIVECFGLGLETDAADPRLFKPAPEVLREDRRLEATEIRDLVPRQPGALLDAVPYDDVELVAPWSFNSTRFEFLAVAERSGLR